MAVSQGVILFMVLIVSFILNAIMTVVVAAAGFFLVSHPE